MNLRRRDVQTQVKHRILADYLSAWSGIILNGLRAKALRHWEQTGVPLPVELVYVDCFAHVGKYSGNTEDYFLDRITGPVDGSPVIGIKALDSALAFAETIPYLTLKVTSILIEQDRRTYQTLLDVLHAEGYGSRLRTGMDWGSLCSGEVAVVHANALELTERLISYTSRPPVFAFYFIDPYGATGHPFNFVRRIIKGRNHDVMINFMYHDLNLKGGIHKSESGKAKRSEKHVAHWTEAYGGEAWQDVLERIEEYRYVREAMYDYLEGCYPAVDDPIQSFQAGISKDAILGDNQLAEVQEYLLIDLYLQTLQNMDKNIAVKSIRLRFPDKERSMFYLFLTTHDGTGAIKLNELLSKARLLEDELRYVRQQLKQQQPSNPSQLFLIPLEKPVPPQKNISTRREVDECCRDLTSRFNGVTVTRREIYRAMADTYYFGNDLDNAIRTMKQRNQVSFTGTLNHNTQIHFTNTT